MAETLENKLWNSLDFWQSAFSLKICLVLISANAIANHDFTLRVLTTFACSNFEKKNKRQLAVWEFAYKHCFEIPIK